MEIVYERRRAGPLHGHGRRARAPTTPCSSTSSSRTRSRSTSTPSPTATRCYIGGIMQHVEEAGVHSGDSSCVLPSISLGEGTLEQVRRQTRALARALGVQGLMNVQFAYQNYELYVLEVNPRASRTVPFVSKATGVQLAKLATRIILGATLAELDPPHRPRAAPRERQGGGHAVRPLPGRRLPARTRDEGDRRGHGGRRHLPAGVRQGAGGRRARRCPSRAPSSCRSATRTSRRPPSSASACTASASPSWRRAARRERCRASAYRRSRSTR